MSRRRWSIAAIVVLGLVLSANRLVRLAATVDAEKVKPNQLGTITMTYDVELPPDDPDAAQVFHDVALRVHEKACTVSTALESVTEIDLKLPA